jgi:hypothetical protein
MTKLGINVTPAKAVTRSDIKTLDVFHYDSHPNLLRVAVSVDQHEVMPSQRGRLASINLATGRLGWAKRGSVRPCTKVAKAALQVTR